MKFHSPYQFIGIKKCPEKNKTNFEKHEDLKSQDNTFVRHDFWHKKGFSGRISCTLTAVSPLVVGAKQISGTKEEFGTVVPYTHKDKKLAIPANSLRGMVSSIAETLSQSSLRILSSEENSTYTVRKEVREPLSDMGVLYKKDNEFYLYPLPEALRIVVYTTTNKKESKEDAQEREAQEQREGRDENAQFIKKAKTFQNKEQPFVYADLIENSKVKNLSYTADPKKIKGILYIRGKIFPSKKNELFIEWDGKIDEDKGINVTQQVQALEKTLRQYKDKQVPDSALPIGYKRDWDNSNRSIVQAGDLLYYKIENNTVTELSYSQIWRRPVNGTLHQALARMTGNQDMLPWNKDRDTLTPAEAIFGVVEDEPSSDNPARNLASRIQFTDAVIAELTKVTLLDPVILRILDSPKPPSPSMYFHAKNGKPISKKDLDLDKHNPNGRKHYVPQPEANNQTTWESKFNENKPPIPKGSYTKNWSQYLQCKPIPTETQFTFDIHFENLSKEELGLLQITIQPNHDAKFIHRLGLGKPLGLGQVSLVMDKIYLIQRAERYSLKGLEQTREIELTAKADDTLVDKQTWEDLKTLYNPDNIKHPVCYPFNSQKGQYPYEEGEGFSWFVENEKARYDKKQQLKQVKAGKEIPTLDSLFK